MDFKDHAFITLKNGLKTEMANVSGVCLNDYIQ